MDKQLSSGNHRHVQSPQFPSTTHRRCSATRKEQKAVFHVDCETAKALHLYVFFFSPEKAVYSNDQNFKLTYE